MPENGFSDVLGYDLLLFPILSIFKVNLSSLLYRKSLKLKSDYHNLRSVVWKQDLAATWFSWISVA